MFTSLFSRFRLSVVYRASLRKVFTGFLLAVTLFTTSPLASVSAASPIKQPIPLPKTIVDGQTDKTLIEPVLPPQSTPNEVLVKFSTLQLAQDMAKQAKDKSGNLQSKTLPSINPLFQSSGVTAAIQPFAASKSVELQKIVLLTINTVATKNKTVQNTIPSALIGSLKSLPQVVYAEPNYIYKAASIPNDPYYNSSGTWGQDYGDLWGVHKIEADSAWDTTQGQGVIVAVSDTGVDFTHPDMASNIWANPGETGTDALGRDKCTNGVDDDNNGYKDDCRGWNFVAKTNSPMDDYGHGTHVAGTIAAVGNNSIGIVGVAYKAKIMPIKGLDSSGQGNTTNLAQGVVYAADNGAKVINMSWGGAGYSQTLQNALIYAHDTKGATLIAAAGNSAADVGTPPGGFLPAGYAQVITVSATDHTDTHAYFSNFGKKIDVAAPGGGDQTPGGTPYVIRSILSLLSAQASSSFSSNGAYSVGSQYVRQAGTSMAAPHVAGVAALILSQHPTYSPEEVRQVLRTSADDAEAPGFDIYTGYGRINARKAILAPVPLIVQYSTTTITSAIGQNAIPIYGQVYGQPFASYSLQYGLGTVPSTWTTFATSNTPVQGISVLGHLDGTIIPDGLYTIRIVATTTTGQMYEDRNTINISNLNLSSPNPDGHTSVRTNSSFTITGLAAPVNFSSYSLNLKDNNGQNVTTNFSLANGGTHPVHGGTLATWNTAGLSSGHYTLTITLTLTDGSLEQQSAQLLVDPDAHPGWPKKIGANSPAVFVLPDTLIAEDFFHDGKKEIPLAYYDQVHLYKSDGSEAPGWPVQLNIAQTNIIESSTTVGDIDGDGYPDIVAGTYNGYVYAWHADGTEIAGWPIQSGLYGQYFSIADLDGDGENEVILNSYGTIVVYGRDGNSKWSTAIDTTVYSSSVSVGDLDGDGKKEVVVSTTGGVRKLYVFRSDGTTSPGFPITLETTSIIDAATPTLADINSDGKLDIITTTDSGLVYVFDRSGHVLPGWPQATSPLLGVHSVSVGDIDGDGIPELVASTQNENNNGIFSNYIYAWHTDGTLLENWPVHYTVDIANYGAGSPALADINGDGLTDVVVIGEGNAANITSLNAWDYRGGSIAGFPKPTTGVNFYTNNTPVIADLDGDGKLNIATLETYSPNYLSVPWQYYNLTVWDTNAPATANAPWPMAGHDPGHTSVASSTTTVLPQITASNINAVTSTTTANITWNTNVPATSRVEYGSTTNYGQSTTLDSTLSATHAVNISGLNFGVTYHYRIISTAPGKTAAISADQTFSTIQVPVVISGIAAVPGVTTASIAWNTSIAATTQVEYGLTTSYGQSTTLGNTLTSTHTASMASLTPNTTYHYRIKSTAPGAIDGVSTDKTFTTLSPPSLLISGISATLTMNSVSVNWTTDLASTSQVEYGTSTDYGQTTTIDNQLTTNHTVVFFNLAPNTTYHYRVKSTAPLATDTISADQTFTTSQPSINILLMIATPSINTALVQWNTDINSTSQVEYGTTTSYGQVTDQGYTVVMNHSIMLTSLTPNTTYHYRVKSTAVGATDVISADQIFTTLPGIEITNIVATPTSASASISWTTSLPSSSQVRYGTTTNYGQLTSLDGTEITTHAMNLSGLVPATTYHYRVISATSNTSTTSPDQTFTTSGTCTRQAPTITVAPPSGGTYPTGTPGTRIGYNLTITNNDSVDCGTSQFNFQATLPDTGWVEDPLTISLDPSSQVPVHAILYITSATSASNGIYGIAMSAVNQSDPTSVSAFQLQYLVTDSQNPRIYPRLGR